MRSARELPASPLHATLLLAVALLAACSREPSVSSTKRARAGPTTALLGPLPFVARPKLAGVDAARVVQKLRPPSEVAPWRLEDAQPSDALLDPVSGGLVLVRADDRNLVVPGAFLPTEFDVVQLRYRSRASGRVVLTLQREGRAVSTTGPLVLDGAPQEKRVDLRLPLNQLEREPGEALRLFVGAEAGAFEVRELVLLKAGPLSGLPLAGRDEPRLLLLGGERRRACAVSSQEPALIEFKPVPKRELAFSVGIPASQAAAALGDVRVRVVVSDGEKRIEDVVERLSPGAWRELRVALGGLRGARLRAQVRCETTTSAEVACYVTEPRLVATAERPPRVLLVTSDTHRGDHLGAAPEGLDVRTPNLDALAASGRLFTRCIASANVTLPSHAALMTGLHPLEVGVLDNRTSLAPEPRTLAEAFGEAGFETWGVTSTRLLANGASGLGRGFERFAEAPNNRRAAEESVAILEAWFRRSAGCTCSTRTRPTDLRRSSSRCTRTRRAAPTRSRAAGRATAARSATSTPRSRRCSTSTATAGSRSRPTTASRWASTASSSSTPSSTPTPCTCRW